MRALDRLAHRLRSLFRRDRLEQDLDEELRFHIEHLAQRHIDAGMTPDRAIATARREFGGAAQVAEQCRDTRRTRWIEDFVRDLGYAVRLFAKSPGFTAVALLSLALGIGANTAVFSLVETIVLRELPVREPAALVRIAGRVGDRTQGSYSYPVYQWLRANAPMFSHVFTWRFTRVWAGQGDSMEWISVQKVSEEYFEGLGASATLGRTLGDESTEPAVAVLSHDWWRARYQAHPAVIGRELRLGGITFTIVGVMPAGFFGAEVGQSPDLYIPLVSERLLASYSNMLTHRNAYWLPLMGRLRKGVTHQRASAGFDAVWRSMQEAAGPIDTSTGRISSGFLRLKGDLQPASNGVSSLRGEFKKPLTVLVAVVAMVLLIACVNLSNFLLARALTRQREMSLRLAMGASRGRLLRQMLTENFLLAVAGAALGLLFAHWSSRLLVALLSSSTSALALNVRLNASVLLYTSGLVVLTTLLFGLAPAVRSLRSASAPLLKEGPHQVKGSMGWSRSLLVAQVALSLMLTFGAALFLRTFRNLTSVNPGFDASRVLVAEVQPIRVGIGNEQAAQFYRDLTARLALFPGVEAVSSADMTPIRSCCWWDPLEVEGYTPAPDESMETFFNRTSPDFFRTMGIRVLRGRDFTARDTLASVPVAIVNDKFANRFFPNGDALGRFVSLPAGYKSPRMEIVGIVADTSLRDLRRPVPYSAYFPMFQSRDVAGARYILVRTSGHPESLATAVRRAVHAFHPAIPVSTHVLSEELDGTLTYDRLLALLGAFFGVVALGLAAIGLYGILSYGVTRRTGEIGVRVALGASRTNILWLVGRQSVTLVLTGMVLGCVAALALARYVESLLFGVTPADPGTIGIAALILFLTTMLAAWLPARRATAIDPVQALRYE